jgi:hypothetical protein
MGFSGVVIARPSLRVLTRNRSWWHFLTDRGALDTCKPRLASQHTHTSETRGVKPRNPTRNNHHQLLHSNRSAHASLSTSMEVRRSTVTAGFYHPSIPVPATDNDSEVPLWPSQKNDGNDGGPRQADNNNEATVTNVSMTASADEQRQRR